MYIRQDKSSTFVLKEQATSFEYLSSPLDQAKRNHVCDVLLARPAFLLVQSTNLKTVTFVCKLVLKVYLY